MTSSTRLSTSDRPAIVTGAASGIGRHLVDVLAARGRSVLAIDNHSAGFVISPFDQSLVHAVDCDVRDEPKVERVLAEFEAANEAPSLVVTCAALSEQSDADQITVEKWRETLDVNVTGAFLVARAAARLMRRVGGGSVILVGSQLGRVTRPQRSAYSTSKAAVEMLAKVLAHDYSPWGVRVNCLAPGPVLTERTRDRLLGADRVSSGGRLLTHRYLNPQDLVGAVDYLAGATSAAVTGSTLLVDGGYCVT